MSLRDELVEVIGGQIVGERYHGTWIKRWRGNPRDEILAGKIADSVLELFDTHTEGGQPNGIGVIEESSYREWYTDERESHQRTVYTFEEPWEPKS